MSTLRDLLLQAERLGAAEVTFRVRLRGYSEDADNRWSASVLLDPRVPNLASGRTGEEALQELVTFLERILG